MLLRMMFSITCKIWMILQTVDKMTCSILNPLIFIFLNFLGRSFKCLRIIKLHLHFIRIIDIQRNRNPLLCLVTTNFVLLWLIIFHKVCNQQNTGNDPF